jgi:hypothetical protein
LLVLVLVLSLARKLLLVLLLEVMAWGQGLDEATSHGVVTACTVER